jgi:streptogramin lyase
VRKAVSAPLTFVWPTTLDVEPGGTLLLVENGLGRLLRIDPVTGHETELAAFTKPYAVRRAPSGSVFVTDGGSLERIDGAARPVRVAEAAGDIGPIAIAPNGDVYYSAAGAIFRLPGGKGTPVRVSGNAQLDVPHGLAVASDGAVLVADTGNDRILRIDVNGGVTALAKVTVPRGMEVAPDGSIYVVDGGASRVLHLGASGERLGVVGPVFDDPYDVTVAPGGVVYVIESLQSGDVRRIARDGTVTVLSRR